MPGIESDQQLPNWESGGFPAELEEPKEKMLSPHMSGLKSKVLAGHSAGSSSLVNGSFAPDPFLPQILSVTGSPHFLS